MTFLLNLLLIPTEQVLGAGSIYGAELYISKLPQSRLQVSKIGIFPQFYEHYVRAARTIYAQPPAFVFSPSEVDF